MKVTFPHLGSMHIFCKAIAETAGIPYIVPPETSRKTLTLGVHPPTQETTPACCNALRRASTALPVGLHLRIIEGFFP